jgi:hypothetical protein
LKFDYQTLDIRWERGGRGNNETINNCRLSAKRICSE